MQTQSVRTFSVDIKWIKTEKWVKLHGKPTASTEFSVYLWRTRNTKIVLHITIHPFLHTTPCVWCQLTLVYRRDHRVCWWNLHSSTRNGSWKWQQISYKLIVLGVGWKWTSPVQLPCYLHGLITVTIDFLSWCSAVGKKLLSRRAWIGCKCLIILHSKTKFHGQFLQYYIYP